VLVVRVLELGHGHPVLAWKRIAIKFRTIFSSFLGQVVCTLSLSTGMNLPTFLTIAILSIILH
jgi:hypothetical protein